MRALVFFLILANLLFWAWVQGYLGTSSNPDAQRAQQQLLAERVRIVSRGEPPGDAKMPLESDRKSEKAVEKLEEKVEELPEPPPVAEPEKRAEDKPVEACLRLADVPVDDAGRLEQSLAEQFPDFKTVRAAGKDASASYWVYIPPLASKKDADAKTIELKKLQVQEYFVIQENGPNNHAISLGLFSTREAADNYLETLKSKKVRSARVAERNARPALATLEMLGPESRLDALRQAVAAVLPGSNPGACGATALSSKS
ncbi:MAG: SPOR domain-containing protein [Propionivibrio sp.]